MVTLLLWCLMLTDSFGPGVRMTEPAAHQSKSEIDPAGLPEAARTRFLLFFVRKGMTSIEVAKVIGVGGKLEGFSNTDSYVTYRPRGMYVRYHMGQAEDFFYFFPWLSLPPGILR